MIRASSAVERFRCKEDVASSNLAPGTMLSGHQPVYLPGILLFNKIALSDAFMFVPHCQYSPKSWQTRNYIRQGNDKIMLSVPVEKNFGQSIDQTKILNTNWRAKHLRSIRQTSSRTMKSRNARSRRFVLSTGLLRHLKSNPNPMLKYKRGLTSTFHLNTRIFVILNPILFTILT